MARLNLPNMRYPPERKLAVYASAMEGLLGLEEDWNRQRKYAEFIDQYADLSDAEAERYRREYIEQNGGQVMGLIARALEEGRQQAMGLIDKAREEGMHQGMRQGEGALLRRLLARRFGPLPSWAEARLAAAEPEQLERWGDRMLDPGAHSLETVLKDD
jgi:hypothetical protein